MSQDKIDECVKPILLGIGSKNLNNKVVINSDKFTIGRAISNNFVIPVIQLSRTHCTIININNKWFITDNSLYGTFVNEEQINKGNPHELTENCKIRLGPHKEYIFQFLFCGDEIPPKKKRKLSESENDQNKEENNIIEKLKQQHAVEKAELEQKLQNEILQQQILIEEKKEIENKFELEKQSKIEWEKRLIEMEEKFKGQQNNKIIIEIKGNDPNLETKIINEEKLLKSKLDQEIDALISEKTELEKKIENNGNGSDFIDAYYQLSNCKLKLGNTEKKKLLLESELKKLEETKSTTPIKDSLQARQEVLNNFGNLMESELQCAVCSELFVKASALNCTHTFCEYCIMEWRKKKNECPVCRTVIKSVNRILALDSFIEKMVENLTEDMKTRRQEIIEERSVQEKKPSQKSKSNPTTSATSSGVTTRSRAAIIEIDDSTSEDDDNLTEGEESYSGFTDDDMDDEYDSLLGDVIDIDNVVQGVRSDIINIENVVRGVRGDIFNIGNVVRGVRRARGAYYGGYGHCFICGSRGHWANGCPQRAGLR